VRSTALPLEFKNQPVLRTPLSMKGLFGSSKNSPDASIARSNSLLLMAKRRWGWPARNQSGTDDARQQCD